MRSVIYNITKSKDRIHNTNVITNKRVDVPETTVVVVVVVVIVAGDVPWVF